MSSKRRKPLPPESRPPTTLSFYVRIDHAELQSLAPIMDIGILREAFGKLCPHALREAVTAAVLPMLAERLESECVYTGTAAELLPRLLRMHRSFAVGQLEGVGIACYDHEDVLELCDALIANIGDGTIEWCNVAPHLET